MVFNHDWWYGGGFERQVRLARECCTAVKFPDYAPAGKAKATPEVAKYCEELETRTMVYLRDGLSYEIKRLVDKKTTAYLSFECVAVEDAYKVGAFIVSVPFDEVCRVETFAVHPSDRPDQAPAIKGFGGRRPPSAGRGDDRVGRGEARDIDLVEDDE
ncbi:MAG: hypothetical protein HUU22_06940 [Phycisphaerae bacterium]|nr:hypothetical protein [Phycisphaerae bacterium]NUQ45751.1 hypothetical protein [Phycisphaerae bacterium]